MKTYLLNYFDIGLEVQNEMSFCRVLLVYLLKLWLPFCSSDRNCLNTFSKVPPNEHLCGITSNSAFQDTR